MGRASRLRYLFGNPRTVIRRELLSMIHKQVLVPQRAPPADNGLVVD
jgi:hypothetical protein